VADDPATRPTPSPGRAHYPWGLATLGHLGLIYLAVVIFLVGVVIAFSAMRGAVKG